MSGVKFEYNDILKEYLFKNNWIEAPLYYNNLGKTLRFDLISKPETESVEKIFSVFDDLFMDSSDMFVVFYGGGGIGWWSSKHYFQWGKLKKLFLEKYNSKAASDWVEPYTYVVVYQTQRKFFKLKKYLDDYLRGRLMGTDIMFI